VISKQGVATYDSKIAAINKCDTPHTVKDVRIFLGVSNYYRIFFGHYGIIIKPMTNLPRNEFVSIGE
jgi:hypothetical protein